jgi:hypothetical protein
MPQFIGVGTIEGTLMLDLFLFVCPSIVLSDGVGQRFAPEKSHLISLANYCLPQRKPLSVLTETGPGFSLDVVINCPIV